MVESKDWKAHRAAGGHAERWTDLERERAAKYKANGYRVQGLPQMLRLSELERKKFAMTKWAVPGFVPEGLTLLAGPKSRGKSFIALDVALAVGLGSHALGNVLCEPGPVLYLALEDSERRIHDRMLAILQGCPAPDNVELACEWKTIDDGGLDDIAAWIAARDGARLVIVDVLAKIKGTPDGRRGVYDQDYALMTPFHVLARDTGVAIVLVHHTNKAGDAADWVNKISGTMGLSGAADTTLVLERAAEAQVGELHVRGRDVAERSVALQFDAEIGSCKLLGPADDFRKSDERREIMQYLRDVKDPKTPVQIALDIGKNRAAVRKLLGKMVTAGEISRLPNGKYYALTKSER